MRFRGPDGVATLAVDELPVQPLDDETLELPAPYELLAPVEPPEIWGAGVTYERSRDARVEESEAKDLYTLVYEAERPELFLKDAAGRRTVGPGGTIGVRSDSTWDVPEPELGARARRARHDRGRDDRQRRLLALDRGREPPLPSAGEDLRGRMRARAGRARARRPRSAVPDPHDGHRRGGRRALRRRDVDRADAPLVSPSSPTGSFARTLSRRAASS